MPDETQQTENPNLGLKSLASGLVSLECPKCGVQLEIGLVDNPNHWPGWGPNNPLLTCLPCGLTGLSTAVEVLRNSQKYRYTLRQLAKIMGVNFYWSNDEVGFSGNWDVFMNGMPYRPAAATLEELFVLLSGNELRLSKEHAKHRNGRKIVCGIVNEF